MARLAEVDFVRTGPISGVTLRRQLLQWAHGWTVSPAVPLAEGNVSLRHVQHGLNETDAVFHSEADARQYLAERGWKPRGDHEPDESKGTDAK